MTADRSRTLIGAALIVIAAWFAYSPALHGGWVFDDELDVTGNLLLRDPSGLWKIWFNPDGLYDYYPIKYTVQWLQWQLWRTDTLGYHLTNVALHVVSSFLFWRILRRLGVQHAWLGGLLFVVHPLAVESVAWITELKNTLSLPLLLLAFLRCLDFDEQRRRGDHVAAVLLFLAALLCKTSVVMFPLTLLVYAWWRHGRIRIVDLKAAAPFFVLSLVFGLITIWFQQQRAIGSVDIPFDPIGGLLPRIACAGSSLAFYAWKTIAPTGLMMMYPQWPVNPPSLSLFLPWVGLAALAAVCWRYRATWGRHALLGTSWFVLHLAPVLGFVPISSQRFTWVMDHLAYLSLLGAIGMAVAMLDVLMSRLAGGALRIALAAIAGGCLLLAIESRRNAATFQSEEALWTHAVRHNPTAWMALYNLGNLASQAGRADEAMDRFRQALRARPDYPEAWNNLGNELRHAGRHEEAIAAYEKAIRLRPAHFAAHNNLAAALAAAGRLPDAIARCEQALRINPRFAPARHNLGNFLTRAGRTDEAITHLREALRLQPDFPEAENDLAVALGNSGRAGEALEHLTHLLHLNPGYAEAHHNLGHNLRRLGRRAEAIEQFKRALEIRPDYVSAHYNLATALFEDGRTTEAAAGLETVLRLAPDHAEAHFSLGNLRAAAGENVAALAHFDQAVQRTPEFSEAHHNAGIVLSRLGRGTEAAERFQRAIDLKPDYVDAWLNLAATLQALGRMNEAVSAYEAARKLRPELPAPGR